MNAASDISSMSAGTELPTTLPAVLLLTGAVLVAGTAAAVAVNRAVGRARRHRRPGRSRRSVTIHWPVVGRWVTGLLAILGATTTAPDAGANASETPRRPPLRETDPHSSHAGASNPGIALMVVRADPDTPRTSLPTAPAEPTSAGFPSEAERAPSAAEPRTVESIGDPATAAEGTHVVEPGDHLWGIAESALALRLGRPPSDEEIVPYWRTVVEANTDQLVDPGNPDLILPGQVIQLPD